MLFMLARKNLLLPRDLPSLPPLQQWIDTLRPGIPFAFCIAAVVTALLTATNLATGLPSNLLSGIQEPLQQPPEIPQYKVILNTHGRSLADAMRLALLL